MQVYRKRPILRRTAGDKKFWNKAGRKDAGDENRNKRSRAAAG